MFNLLIIFSIKYCQAYKYTLANPFIETYLFLKNIKVLLMRKRLVLHKKVDITFSVHNLCSYIFGIKRFFAIPMVTDINRKTYSGNSLFAPVSRVPLLKLHFSKVKERDSNYFHTCICTFDRGLFFCIFILLCIIAINLFYFFVFPLTFIFLT